MQEPGERTNHLSRNQRAEYLVFFPVFFGLYTVHQQAKNVGLPIKMKKSTICESFFNIKKCIYRKIPEILYIV